MKSIPANSKNLESIEASLNVCPSCKVVAALRQNRRTGLFFVECSNGIDCGEWPMTADQESPALAAAAWNNGQTFTA